MNKNKTTLCVCFVAFLVNAVLFFVKLYIGLRTNSISIYSDSLNNLFDSLSGLLTLVSLILIVRKAASSEEIIKRSEQLFSFVMSVAVALAGFYFAYSSLERLMYPAPVWYTPLYLVMLAVTAAVKIFLFFFYRTFYKKTASPVIKVMSVDSILDFFITAVTVLTLYISGKGSFSFDAIFGILISVLIIVSAVKLIISNAKEIIGFT